MGDPSSQMPALTLGFVRDRVSRDGKVFRFDETGANCLTLSVLNASPTHPHRGVTYDARSVFASVVFLKSGRRKTTIGRACWIAHKNSEIPIDIGDIAHILIGFPSHSEWVCFRNPNKYGLDIVESDNPFADPAPKTVEWPDAASLGVDVKIVSTAAASKGQIFAHRRFQLTHNGIAYTAQWSE